MKSASGKKRAHRVPPSKYWAQYWNSCAIGSLATVQLVMLFGIVGMEIGNALVDLYKANVFSGFWSFPFTLAATIATYACVCAKKTETKAIVALIFQSIALLVLLVAIGFLIAFIISNFTLCIGFQCTQTSTTFVSTSNTAYLTFSSTTYALLKQVFIICELVCAVIYIIFSIIYIILFIRCRKQLPRIHPLKRAPPIQSAVSNRLTPSVSQSSRPSSMSNISSMRSDVNEQTHTVPSATKSNIVAQKVCPNCGHISPYIPHEDIVECPKCDYQSRLVEHAQQWYEK